MNYDKLFSPMKIGSCEIKNRIVMAPMLMGFGQFDGTATEQMMDYYEERAKGGTGLIITEITRVNDKTGAAAFAQLGVSHDYQIKPLSELADRIHKHGAKLFVQLHHPGRQNVGLLVGTVPLSISLQKTTGGAYGKLLYKMTPKVGPVLLHNNIVPHSVAPSKCEPAYFAGGKVRALRNSEIKELVTQFVDGAERVKKASCDGVELHASHGYLLQQFFSPVTNQRTDEYGGSFDNRMRFITEIISGIRERCGKDFPLIVRLTVDECYDRIGMPGKGYNLEEGVKIAKRLEELGVDAIDVSSAGYDTFNYWLEPVSFELGWRKYMAKAVKDVVSIPVIAANLIRSPEQAEAQLEEGTQDFISLGRPHIADPHWAEKAQSGNGKDISRCICCLHCIESMQNNAYIGGHGECAVNPRVGLEKTELNKNGNGRIVAVVGAGAAGLMAARILGERGFKPIVLEKKSKPGGQLNLAASAPGKAKIGWLIEDAVNAAVKNGAEIKFDTEATADIIDEIKPCAVILAAGSNPIKPRFGGSCNPDTIITFEDVLSGKVQLNGKDIAVIGSGLTGLECSLFLAEQGNKVSIFEMADEIAPGAWMQHKDDLMPKLLAAGVRISTSEKVIEINEDTIVTENKNSRVKASFKCDVVVLSIGSRPDKSLEKELTDKGYKVFDIGDCKAVGNIANATRTAYDTAAAL